MTPLQNSIHFSSLFLRDQLKRIQKHRAIVASSSLFAGYLLVRVSSIGRVFMIIEKYCENILSS